MSATVTRRLPRPRPATAAAVLLLIDASVLLFFVAVAVASIHYLRHALAPIQKVTPIELSVSAIPGYALLSLTRVVISYGLSLLYTVIYGTIAAKNARAERVMIPLLDVLQGVPVLGFLPGVGLAMIALFPRSNVGIELTCILMIFTAMPWNMAYSYFSSLRTIPEELESIARLHRFNAWQRFTKLELPVAMRGLIWNSMMSLAGGWFFLMILEVFKLRNFTSGENELFVLPGIGAYMAEAYRVSNWTAVAWALATMTLIVVVTDQLVWKPIVAWSRRFEVHDREGSLPHTWVGDVLSQSRVISSLRRAQIAIVTTLAREQTAPPSSWIASLLARSRILGALSRGLRAAGTVLAAIPEPRPGSKRAMVRQALARVVPLLFYAAGLWLLVKLLVLLHGVTLARWGEVGLGLGLTTLRLVASVAIGAALMIPIGVVIGISPRLARRAQPVVQVVASFPAPMFFPLISLAILRFLGEPAFGWACVLLTLFGTQWYVLFNVIAGATAIPEDLKEVARTYRLGGLSRWRQLYLPGVMPYLMTGLFTAAGGAWNGAIVAEYQELEGRTLQARGLGSLISHATYEGDYGTLAASVVALVVTIVLLNRFVWSPLHKKCDVRYALV